MNPVKKQSMPTRPEHLNWRKLTPPTRAEMVVLSRLIHEQTGLLSEGSRENFLSAGVLQRMVTLGVNSVAAYTKLLQTSSSGADELRHLANILLVHKTSFFRDRPHFALLEKRILPELKHHGQPIRIWSAGCSTGQEVYSLALTLQRAGISPNQAQVLGTDLSPSALDVARRAVYPDKQIKDLTDDERDLFEAIDEHQVCVASPLMRYVRFEQHNLVDLPYPSLAGEAWQIIFCRNVLIYFSRSTIRSIIERFHRNMASHGGLFLGACESLLQLSEGFELEQGDDVFIYRKKSLSGSTSRPSLIRPPGRATPDPERPAPAPPSTDVRPKPVPRQSILPTATIDELLAESNELLSTGKPAMARSMLLQAAEHWPAEQGILSALGRLAFETGDMQEARSWLSASLKRDPLDVYNLFLSGLTLFHLGLDGEAAEHLRRLLYLERGFALGYYYQGQIAARMGQENLAQRAYRNSILALDKGSAPKDPRLAISPTDGDLIKKACQAKMATAVMLGSKGGKS